MAAAGLGLALMAMAVPRIVSGALIWPHEPVLHLIQRGAEIPVEALVQARRDYEAAIAWHAGAGERATLAIVRLRLALALGTATPGGRAVLGSARDMKRLGTGAPERGRQAPLTLENSGI